MRIAMLTNNYKPFVGGVPISIERLSGGLRERGHEVTIFAPGYADEAEEPGVVRYPSRRKKLKGDITIPRVLDSTISEHLAYGGYDLIHMHHPMLSGYTGRFLAGKYGIPTTLTLHTRYEQYLHYIPPVERLKSRRRQDGRGGVNRALGVLEGLVPRHNAVMANGCNLVFAPSDSIRDYLWESGVRTPVRVLPTGLADEDYVWDGEKSREIRERYTGQEEKLLFVSVSRLEEEKNIPLMLEALAEFKERAGDCFKLLLIGSGSYKPELEMWIRRLRLWDNVVFTGCIPHSEMGSYYGAADLFLFSSKSETQGIVLLEAMAAGLPVAAVEASGVSDVVVNGHNGFCSGDDPEELSGCISRICFDDGIRTRLRRGARDTALGWDYARMAQAAEEGYFDAVRSFRGVPKRLRGEVGVI